MKIKKIAAALVLPLALGAVSTACANKKTGKKETTELLWYVVGGQQKDMKLVNDELNKMLAEKSDIQVNIKMLDWNAYDQKMNMIISTKEEFDLCWTAPQTNDYYNNIARNAFVPLDDLMEKYAPKTKALVSDELWEATRVNGKIYGSINYQVMATAYGYAVQRPVMNASGLNYAEITNYNDLDDILAFAKENYPDKIPLKYSNTQEPFTSSLPMFGMEAIGGNQTPGALVRGTDDYKVVNQYETEEFKKFITKMHEWYKKGYLQSDAATTSELSANKKAGKYVVFFPQYLTGDSTESDKTPDAPYEDTGIPYYTKKFTPEYITTDRAIATMTAISSTSKHPEKAMQLIEILNTDEDIYNTLCIGIEGKHYNKLKEPFTNIYGANVTIEKIENSGYAPNSNWMFGNTAQEWKTENNGPAQDWMDANAKAEYSEIMGFAFDTDPVANEISMCSSVLGEYLTSLTSGSTEPTKRYDEFIAKLKTAGADKIVEEKQKQLDEWLKTK